MLIPSRLMLTLTLQWKYALLMCLVQGPADISACTNHGLLTHLIYKLERDQRLICAVLTLAWYHTFVRILLKFALSAITSEQLHRYQKVSANVR